MEKYLCLPYNGDPLLIKYVLEKYDTNKIHQFYGATMEHHTGRISKYKREPLVERKQIEKIIKDLSKYNIAFNYVYNDVGMVGYTEENLRKEFKWLSDIGCKHITAISPYVGLLAKEYGFKITSSVFQNVYESQKLQQLIDYGYDSVILNRDLVKFPYLIKQLKEQAKEVKLEILVNEFCKMGCSLCYCETHSIKTNDNNNYFHNIIQNHCKNHETWTPKNILKRNFVRTKDFNRYSDVGISLFKIQGRQELTENLIIQLKIILENKQYPFRKMINENSLDDFINFLFNDGCKNNCLTCGYCETYWDSHPINIEDDQIYPEL